MSGVVVAMCTYNAAKYIGEQLDSLLNQSYDNFKIVIYDDCSSDDTVDIIRKNMDKDNRIELHVNEENLGPALNFKSIVQGCSGADYLFLCDQDDVWDLHKIETMLNTVREKESVDNKPYLIAHNYNISDKNNVVLYKKCIQSVYFYDLIMKPQIPGCCMLLNHAALELVKWNKYDISMHDWYISLIIALYGEIVIVDEPLINYRQHANNQIGCKKYSKFDRIKMAVNDNKKIKNYSKLEIVIVDEPLINYRQHANNQIGCKKYSKFDRIKMAVNDNKKIKNYSKLLEQLYAVGVNYPQCQFLSDYNRNYEKRNSNGVIKLFFDNGVLSRDVHGIYQVYIIKKAMKNIELFQDKR